MLQLKRDMDQKNYHKVSNEYGFSYQQLQMTKELLAKQKNLDSDMVDTTTNPIDQLTNQVQEAQTKKAVEDAQAVNLTLPDHLIAIQDSLGPLINRLQIKSSQQV